HLGCERLQTMLAFGDAQDAMTALQRSDTEARMEDLPLPKIGKPMWIVMIAAAAVALALLVVALMLPVNGQGPGPGPEPDPETPFTFTEWQQARLRELIAYVEGSALEESARTLAVSELNTLYNDLFAVTTRAAMLARVTGTMAVIDDKIEQINTFEEVIGALAASADVELLALAKAIGKVTEIPNQSELETLKAAYAEKQNGFFEALASKIEIDLTKLISYKDGALYAALERMAADLKVLDGALSAVPDPTAREILIGSTIDVCMARIADAVADQAVNRNVGDTVILELMFIFDITQSELPASILDNGISYANPDGNYQEKDEEVSSEGGAGRDEMNYAGNDEVYDPEDDKIVQYGAIYKTYSAIMREKKNQGQLPEEYEKFITDYFSALYRGD
ncbi:MAG: hypothetical protein IJW22_01475, partial [Clostridia bacterium]|nr:hypothetical protein [Clostridia bacterium]